MSCLWADIELMWRKSAQQAAVATTHPAPRPAAFWNLLLNRWHWEKREASDLGRAAKFLPTKKLSFCFNWTSSGEKEKDQYTFGVMIMDKWIESIGKSEFIVVNEECDCHCCCRFDHSAAHWAVMRCRRGWSSGQRSTAWRDDRTIM